MPYEILARGKKCIEIFKKAMADAKAPASRMKVIVVGEVGAGKTSLTRSLSGQPFVEEREITHGIETCFVDEMMENTELNCSWKLADPEESHVDQIIATLLSKCLDLDDLPDVQKLLRQQEPVLSPLAALPPSPSDWLAIEEAHEYPGLFSSPSPNRSCVMVTDKKIEVDGSPRKLPASLVARALFEKEKRKASSVKVNIWDFAGHHLYETMHHLFLNSRSLYLVVFNLLRMVECEEKCLATIHYWLNSIAVHTSTSSPIFVVGTHRGKVDEETVVHANEIIKTHFDDAFGSRMVRKAKDEYVFAVENSGGQNDVGVSCLMNAIKKEASDLPFVDEERPVKWLHCEEEILAYQQDPNCQKCLTIDELRKHFDEKCNVTFTNEEFRSMLNFFHDSGLIILPGNFKISFHFPYRCLHFVALVSSLFLFRDSSVSNPLATYFLPSHTFTSNSMPSYPLLPLTSFPILSLSILSHLIPPNLVSSRLVSSRLASSRLVSPRLVSPRLISSHLISSHLISSFHLFPFLLLPCHSIPFHSFPSHYIPIPIDSS